MDILDFPIARRRSTGWSATASDSAILDFDRRSRSTCMHERMDVSGLTLDLCPDTAEAHWLSGDSESLEPVEALASLFGSFDLRASLSGLDAPGAAVLIYRPDSRRGRQAMRSLPLRRWIHAAPGLWLTHDGENLLMSPEDTLLAENLSRDLVHAP